MTVRELIEALRRLPAEARGLEVLAETESYCHRVSEVRADPQTRAVYLRELPPPPPPPPPERVAGRTVSGGATE